MTTAVAVRKKSAYPTTRATVIYIWKRNGWRKYKVRER